MWPSPRQMVSRAAKEEEGPRDARWQQSALLTVHRPLGLSLGPFERGPGEVLLRWGAVSSVFTFLTTCSPSTSLPDQTRRARGTANPV